MSWNNFEQKNNSNSETDFLSTESTQALQEIAQDSKELQGEIQYFEYKNKSKNWEYYVFSYNVITWEKAEDIKKKYTQQFWWKINWILITDEKWKELQEREFSQPRKIYLKINIKDNPKPMEFTSSNESFKTKYICHIKNKWRTPWNIRQIYQDEKDTVIEKDNFIISDEYGNIYDDSKKFEPWDIIKLEIKKTEPNNNNKAIDTALWKINYKEIIEKQNSPITMWNKNNPEISITFDDGYWTECIKHILYTLKASGIKATFFILWDCLKNTPDLWKTAVKEWHQICCHTFSHIYLSDNSDITDLTSGLNREINIHTRENNVKSLLWDNYYNKIKAESWDWFPNKIKSTILLRTEILMWEAQIKKTLWNDYLKTFKQNYPFFRFPWWCGAHRSSNIAVLKNLWYLSIWWSEDFYKWNGKDRRHMTTSEMQNMNISNWNIPLFHFKKDDYKYIDAYIENMKKRWKSSKVISKVINK